MESSVPTALPPGNRTFIKECLAPVLLFYNILRLMHTNILQVYYLKCWYLAGVAHKPQNMTWYVFVIILKHISRNSIWPNYRTLLLESNQRHGLYKRSCVHVPMPIPYPVMEYCTLWLLQKHILFIYMAYIIICILLTFFWF